MSGAAEGNPRPPGSAVGFAEGLWEIPAPEVEDQNEPLAGGSRSRFPPFGRRYAKPPAAALLTGQAVANWLRLRLRPVCSFVCFSGERARCPLFPCKGKIGLPVLPPLAFISLRAGSTRIRSRWILRRPFGRVIPLRLVPLPPLPRCSARVRGAGAGLRPLRA